MCTEAKYHQESEAPKIYSIETVCKRSWLYDYQAFWMFHTTASLPVSTDNWEMSIMLVGKQKELNSTSISSNQ